MAQFPAYVLSRSIGCCCSQLSEKPSSYASYCVYLLCVTRFSVSLANILSRRKEVEAAAQRGQYDSTFLNLQQRILLDLMANYNFKEVTPIWVIG